MIFDWWEFMQHSKNLKYRIINKPTFKILVVWGVFFTEID